jgi:hypothetical protein
MIKQYILLLALVFFMSSLKHASAQEIRRAISLECPLDQVAGLFAGNAVGPNDHLHDHAMKVAWSNYQEEQSAPMKRWAKQELSSRIESPKVVRYFFSGPDILSVLDLFPESPLYILCAREPVGSIAPLEQLSSEQLSMGLAGLRESTNTFLKYGYFITKEMKTQMSRGSFQGVLPLLLTFLALSDHEIISVEKMPLGGAPGLCIRFKERSTGREQKLFYAQADLSNEGNLAFLKWLRSFGPGAAYLKAASYLLHEDSFSCARNFLLSNSETILQDDSGIPVRFFEQREWNLYLFGDYKKPLEIFKKYDQHDLSLMYAASPLHVPMPFGTGYHFQEGESGGANLLLAVRRNFVPRALPIKKEN